MIATEHRILTTEPHEPHRTMTDRTVAHTRLSPTEIDTLVTDLAGYVAYARRIPTDHDTPWGQTTDLDNNPSRSAHSSSPSARVHAFHAEVTALRHTLTQTGVTAGTASALRQLAFWGPDSAIRRAHAMHTTPFTPDHTTPIPTELTSMIHNIDAAAPHLTFETVNQARPIGSTIALTNCREPLDAANNCHMVTQRVDSLVTSDELIPDGWTAARIETLHIHPSDTRLSGVHWANRFTHTATGDTWIVDYTARQFGADAPFPMVARYNTWLTHITTRTEQIYQAHLDTVYEHITGNEHVLYARTPDTSNK